MQETSRAPRGKGKLRTDEGLVQELKAQNKILQNELRLVRIMYEHVLKQDSALREENSRLQKLELETP